MYPNLKLEIFKKGLRQSHMARTLGIREPILSRIIHGHKEPSDTIKKMIAELLQADEAWLFEKYSSAGVAPASDAALQEK